MAKTKKKTTTKNKNSLLDRLNKEAAKNHELLANAAPSEREYIRSLTAKGRPTESAIKFFED